MGKTFGKCRLIRLLGRGGMGKVYLAEHLFLRRKVAVKVLSSKLCGEPEIVERFEREAVTAAGLDHPNIVRIHDVDEVEGRPYIVMEYVEGETLEALIRREAPLPARSAAWIAREVAGALGHAHALGFIHRDVKPGNILISKDGKVKLADFGLAKDLKRPDETQSVGLVLGTPYYVSPEQARGERPDPRSDLYSLGVVMYAMLTGKKPFDGRTATSVIKKHVFLPRPSPLTLRPTLARALAAIVQKLMAQRRSDRYASAKHLLKDLKLFLAGKPFLRVRQG
jgi:serine/threonine-protein kinase